ncbi:MAG: hypothetical protein ABIH24_03720 [Verrucomicrobiota bacterium]
MSNAFPNNTESDVVHLKAGEHLPVVPAPSPTTEMLKQLLEQMLENERRRLRNEYVRITLLFLVFLATAIGGGLWFATSLLDQLRAERQIAERSLQALLQRDTRDRGQRSEDRGQRSEVREQGAAIRNQQPGKSEISNTSARNVPAPAADINIVQAQADIKRILADMEAEKQALADMLQSQDAQTKDLLQNRDSDLKILHERMQEMQRKIINAAPSEAQPEKKAESAAAIEEKADNSLTIKTTNAITLRLPIPAP